MPRTKEKQRLENALNAIDKFFGVPLREDGTLLTSKPKDKKVPKPKDKKESK